MEPGQFREWRKSLNLTQAQAADKLGLAMRTISGYESVGGIPKHVALACTALSFFSRYSPLDKDEAAKLLKEQYPDLGFGEKALVLDAELIRGRTYTHLKFRLDFEDESKKWVADWTPSAQLSLQKVRTRTGEHEVPVVTFDSLTEAVYFKLHWN